MTNMTGTRFPMPSAAFHNRPGDHPGGRGGGAPGSMTTKEMTAKMRGEIKDSGVAGAAVRMAPGSRNVIQVYPSGGVDARFTHDEQKKIGEIARGNGLTLTRGLPIDTTHDIKGHGFVFEHGHQRR